MTTTDTNHETPAHHGDIATETFRQNAYHIVDWIANYLETPEHYPVFSQCAPGDIRTQFPDAPPQHGEPMEAIINDFEHVIVPGITHWNHPGFYAYFATSASAPGILGEMLTAGLNVNAMLWRTSPAATELEELTLDWLRQMLGLPADFRGCIMDTASSSTMVAIAAARERLGLDIRKRGMAGRSDIPRLRLYTSEQAHSSVEKAAIVLGIGQDGVRKIPTNADFQMEPAALAAAIVEDIAHGWLPFCVVATVGTTSTTSIDPVPAIAAICRTHNLWLHVDGAYGGSAALVPELRDTILAGCDHADSFVVNPHKWLFTPLDCSVLYVHNSDTLRQAFSLVPEYLTSNVDDVTNFMDWGVQLGRRFRALKLWMIMRAFGVEGLAARLREHIHFAQQLARWIDDHPDFERLAPTPLSTVCFRACPHEIATRLRQADAEETTALEAQLDQLNAAIITHINEHGEAFISHTRLHGRYTIRVAIGNIRTELAHIQRLWEQVCAAAKQLSAT
jgi:aromatic-L-amino-acid decarboxylase